jgi:hypothetical protein
LYLIIYYEISYKLEYELIFSYFGHNKCGLYFLIILRIGLLNGLTEILIILIFHFLLILYQEKIIYKNKLYFIYILN